MSTIPPPSNWPRACATSISPSTSLLLFIVGVKRRHRIDDGIEVGPPPPRRRAAREETEDEADEARDDEA